VSLRAKLLLALSPLLLALGIAVIAGGMMSASSAFLSRRISTTTAAAFSPRSA
jgi:hypothetical protein